MDKSISREIMRDRDMQAAFGVLVGQIAHDLNNLLTPLLAYPELVRQELPEGSQSHHLLDVMEKASGDMMYLASQLLDFSMRNSKGSSAIDFNYIVDGVVASLERDGLPEEVSIEKSLIDEAPSISGSEELILSAVSNLCDNALEAMEGSGKLTISTSLVQGDGGDKYVRISVSDTGAGISPDLADSIFEPFVTDKRSSRRRAPGLGLSIVKRVMDEYGGRVDFLTEPGKGTVFHLDFPVRKEGKVSDELNE